MKSFAIVLLVGFICNQSFAGQKIEIKIGTQETQSFIFEDKVVDGIDAYYLEHNTLQKQKVFRAVTKDEFEMVTKEFSKLNELLKTKGKIVGAKPCKESIDMIVYAITQSVCIDQFSKKEKKKFHDWFKTSAEAAAGPAKK